MSSYPPSHTPDEIKLIMAVKSSNIQDLKQMLELGINPNIMTKLFYDLGYGYCGRDISLLEYAVNYSLVDVIGELTRHGACVNVQMLVTAIKRKQVEIVKLLLDANATNTNYILQDSSELNPFFVAIKSSNTDIIRLFLQSGADPNIVFKSQFGLVQTPLSMSIFSENIDIIKLLLDYGANPRDDIGFSRSCVDIARFKLSSGHEIVNLLDTADLPVKGVNSVTLTGY